MAEFCLTCYQRILKGKETKRQMVLSKRPELCEGCGACEPVVLQVRRPPFDGLLRFLFTGRARF